MTPQQHRERILAGAEHCMVQGDDGFWLFWPTKNEGGWSAVDLMVIAEEMNVRNKPWAEKMAADLKAILDLTPSFVPFAQFEQGWDKFAERYKK